MADSGISLDEIQNMKVTDLRKKLKAFGLPLTGNKNELVERLQEACLSTKGGDSSFDNSQLSYDESQISELETTEDNGVLEESALLDQDQISSYINSSLEEDSKILHRVENNSSSKTVIMPPKKRTFTKISVETTEKRILLNRTNATDLDFDIQEKKTESKPVPLSSDIKDSSSDEKIKLSLKNMSAAERLAMRAKRFNVNDVGVKTTTSLKSAKSSNTNRNSKQSILSSATTPDLDVLKKRADRFGQCVSTVMKQIEQKERLLKRKCKFGATLASSAVTSVDEQEKKKQRAERFGILSKKL